MEIDEFGIGEGRVRGAVANVRELEALSCFALVVLEIPSYNGNGFADVDLFGGDIGDHALERRLVHDYSHPFTVGNVTPRQDGEARCAAIEGMNAMRKIDLDGVVFVGWERLFARVNRNREEAEDCGAHVDGLSFLDCFFEWWPVGRTHVPTMGTIFYFFLLRGLGASKLIEALLYHANG